MEVTKRQAYKLCPKCELNYIPAGSGFCKLCDPKQNAKYLAETAEELAFETELQERKERREQERQRKNDFLAMRYDRPARR